MDLDSAYRRDTLPYPNVTSCGYFLNASSTSPVVMTGYARNSQDLTGETLVMRTLGLYGARSSSDPLLYDGSINFEDIPDRLLDFLVVGTLNGAAGVLRNGTPRAQKCMMRWCVKTVHSYF